MLIEDDSQMGMILDYEVDGDLFEMVMTMSEEEMELEITNQFVRKVDQNDANLVGNWNMTSVLIDGVPEPDSREVNISVVDDGTGVWTDDGDVTDFTWTTNLEYMVVHPEEDEIPEEMQMAFRYEITGDELRMFYYEMGFPTSVAVIEIYSRVTD